MNLKQEGREKGKLAETFLIAGIILVMLLVFSAMYRQGFGRKAEKLKPLSSGWYYMENGQRKDVILPAEVEAGEIFVLYNDSLSEEMAGQTLTTRGARYDLTISLGSQILYEYSDKAFPRNIQMKSKLFCDAVLPADIGGRTLILRYFGSGQELYKLEPVYIGSGRAAADQHYSDSAATVGIVFVMAAASLCAMGVSVYLRHIKMRDRRFMDAAAFLILCGIWSVTDSALIQQYSLRPEITCLISFYAFMLMSVPMLHFVQNTGEMRKYRIIQIYIWIFYLNAILQGVLNYLHVFEFVDMLFVTHILLLTGVTVLDILMFKEYRRTKNKEIFNILLAFATLGASGVSALLLYWSLEITFYGIMFECGILIFVALILSGIITAMADNIRFKTEMEVYQRLAREDRLTGLGNRRAFEEFLTELQKNADTIENAVLIFMDLNRLKYVNDRFGHNAGDELIIASARCIESAFSREGTCYRIGGDEFCAVILNPKGTEKEWFEQLDREIAVYNQNSRYELSIARGLSYLREKDGSIKTVSDWKYEADQKMYEDKGERKRI